MRFFTLSTLLLAALASPPSLAAETYVTYDGSTAASGPLTPTPCVTPPLPLNIFFKNCY